MPTLPPAFLDELRARTPIASVIGRKVRLVRSGRDWKGLCPFHTEKTPSFYAYEPTPTKHAHYWCFGCGVGGDVIDFVQRDTGMDFREAVDALARECGLDVPRDPEEDARIRRLDVLREVLSGHAELWQAKLWGEEGKPALDYLRGRGLTDETIRAWGIGWVGRGGVLAERDPTVLRDAGLMGSNGGPLLVNRVTFPVCDERGRVIAFSGRTLGDGQPKYLNSPEGPLWAKGRVVFGLHLARASRDPWVVVEGQIDAIALGQGGIPAVAPLGTALTADQLAAVWRYCPAPILALDGDSAGRKATRRALTDTALPHLTTTRTLRVARVPDGHDPDTLLRVEGLDAVRGVLAAAEPFHAALYDALAGDGAETPEARAALAKALDDAAGRIGDRALAAEYRTTLRERYRAQFRPAPARTPARPDFRAQFRDTTPLPEIMDAAPHQARTLAAIVLRHPALLPEVAERWAAMDLPDDMARLRAVILAQPEDEDGPDPAAFMAAAEGAGFAMADVLSDAPIPLPPCAQPDAPLHVASEGWWHIFALLSRRGMEAELLQAQEEAAELNTPEAWRRLVGLAKARVAAMNGRNVG